MSFFYLKRCLILTKFFDVFQQHKSASHHYSESIIGNWFLSLKNNQYKWSVNKNQHLWYFCDLNCSLQKHRIKKTVQIDSLLIIIQPESSFCKHSLKTHISNIVFEKVKKNVQHIFGTFLLTWRNLTDSYFVADHFHWLSTLHQTSWGEK